MAVIKYRYGKKSKDNVMDISLSYFDPFTYEIIGIAKVFDAELLDDFERAFKMFENMEGISVDKKKQIIRFDYVDIQVFDIFYGFVKIHYKVALHSTKFEKEELEKLKEQSKKRKLKALKQRNDDDYE